MKREKKYKSTDMIISLRRKDHTVASHAGFFGDSYYLLPTCGEEVIRVPLKRLRGRLDHTAMESFLDGCELCPPFKVEDFNKGQKTKHVVR